MADALLIHSGQLGYVEWTNMGPWSATTVNLDGCVPLTMHLMAAFMCDGLVGHERTVDDRKS
jgi:hypothetical protein